MRNSLLLLLLCVKEDLIFRYVPFKILKFKRTVLNYLVLALLYGCYVYYTVKSVNIVHMFLCYFYNTKSRKYNTLFYRYIFLVLLLQFF